MKTVYEKEEAFWKKQFSSDESIISLPYSKFALKDLGDRDRNHIQVSNHTLSPEVAQKILTISNGSNMALFMILLAGVEAILYKYSYEEKENIILGVPTTQANGHAPVTDLVILKNKISNQHTFKTLLNEIRLSLQETIKYQNIPFWKMVENLHIEYDENELPIVNTFVSLKELHQFDYKQSIVPDMMFEFSLKSSLVHVDVIYNGTHFDQNFISQLIQHLNQLFSIVLFQPEIEIHNIDILLPNERNQLLQDFNDTAQDYPTQRTIHQIFEEQAERTPDAVAVIFENRNMTYRELNERANQLARTLRTKGVKADQLVGVMAERSFEMIIGIYAVLKAGGAYIPIDPTHPEERIRYIMEDANADVLLVQSHLLDRISFNGEQIVLEDEKSYHEDSSNLGEMSSPQHLAYVIYTSGTTGRPKGVMIEHHSAINRILWMQERYPIDANDTILQKTAVTFDVSVWELFWWAMVGSKVCLLSVGGEKNPEEILNTIEEHSITTMHFVPAMLSAFLEYLEHHSTQDSQDKLKSLRQVFASGEALTPNHANRFMQLISSVNQAQIINLYGPTEATVDVSYFDCPVNDEIFMVPIGKPISNIQLYIVNQNRQLQAIGVPGELCISGVGLARGYYNRPELTEEKFVPNPFVAGERMYRTGDLARWLPDGNIEYLGRIDHQVKIRGYRIELGEVEAQLLKIDSIQEAIVLAREEKTGQKQLCAYFTSNQKQSMNEIRDALSKELPEYMIPAYFVQLQQMPLSPNGKIDRKALPVPEESIESGTTYVAPRTEVERTLATLWQQLLGIPKVGINDHFFALGGDSIKLIQISSRLYQVGYKLEMKHLFKYPTIAKLSPFVQTIDRTIDQAEVKGEARLTPIQSWFFERNWADSHYFNQATMLYKKEGFTEAALRKVLQKIVEHHDALRTVFRQQDHSIQPWIRGIDEEELFTLEVFDFRQVADCAKAIEDQATKIQSSIHLNEGPLMKVGLFHCEDGDHLLIAIHHLVIDGISWRILFEDIQMGYEQAIHGEEIRLPLKTDSYLKWAEDLSVYAENKLMEKEADYWRQIAQLKTDSLPREQVQDQALIRDRESLHVQWSQEETELLLKQVPQAYNTEINDILLVALAKALHKWSGLERFKIHMEGHGREEILENIDITRTVGWFTSLYPVVLEVEPDKQLSYQIKKVKENLRHIPHKGIGYGVWKYLSSYSQEVDFQDEAEICFNYLGQFDQELESNELSPYSSGAQRSSQQKQTYVLDINGMISEGALLFDISYNGKEYNQENMTQLATCFKESLQEIIAHCSAKDRTELTPSDVLLQEVTLEELDEIVAQTKHIGQIENLYKLTPMQKGMWFHNQMDSQSGAYFQQLRFVLQGDLDVEKIKESFSLLIQRHAILRTNFYTGWDEEPIQIVYRDKPVEFFYNDISEMTQNDRDEKMNLFLEEDKERGFALDHDALIRLSILRTDEKEHHLIWSFHHILMDGWCLPILVTEMFETYFALENNDTPEMNVVSSYSDYIKWLQEQDTEEASAYWKSYLEGYEGQTALPQESDQLKEVEYATKRIQCSLGEELTNKMNMMAKQHQVTVNTLIQVAWGILLQKYNGSKDVVFGSVVSGRPAEIPGIEDMIGLFINTTPVRIRCEAEEAIGEVMRRTQEQVLSSQSYDFYPLYEIQAQSDQKQNLINHIMVFENYPVEEKIEKTESANTGSLEIMDVSTEEQTNYDFNLIVLPSEELQLKMEYNANVFTSETVERIQKHLVHFLKQIANTSELLVKDLDVATEEEKMQILHVFNETDADYPKEKTIHQLFEDR
ncbi:non-ribosomal peptide synthetase [Caldalkalibacillus mannanilyticus]|uniref:non-ribosomal peptide synthetase n=1 Tax=Caldalkalibacillus mannanilyticus TaxID=1418 RepID=UPI00068631E0|nr:non-ribosomal peptide synthetase [Caldalkalibacillus mannanilyticus]